MGIYLTLVKEAGAIRSGLGVTSSGVDRFADLIRALGRKAGWRVFTQGSKVIGIPLSARVATRTALAGEDAGRGFNQVAVGMRKLRGVLPKAL